MSIESPLAKRLKTARLAKQISQKHLGELAGIDELTASPRMNQYETGKHAPDYVTIKHIAGVLGVPVSYFYEEEDWRARMILEASPEESG